MTENTTVKTKAIKSSLTKRKFQKFCRNKMAVLCTFVLGLLVFACVFAPLLTPHDPGEINVMLKYADPSPEHPFGCDRMGRDLLARVLYGGRWSLFLGFAASLSCNVVGMSIGMAAAYFGGKVDKALVSLSEITTLMPTTLILILIGSMMKINIWTLLLFWTIFGWAGTMRSTRSRVMSIRTEPFVESCVANGISKTSIMFRHILPNTSGPFIVSITMNVAFWILAEAGLSYLGYGLDSSIPTWGNLMNATKSFEQLTGEPIQWLIPGACICILTICANFIGDGLQDAIDATAR